MNKIMWSSSQLISDSLTTYDHYKSIRPLALQQASDGRKSTYNILLILSPYVIHSSAENKINYKYGCRHISLLLIHQGQKDINSKF